MMDARAMSAIRGMVEEWMVDEIEIWSESSSQYDEATLRDEHMPGTLYWSGKARISPTTGPREQALAEGVLQMRDADILAPIDANPAVDDEVRVVSSADPALQGRWFRITDVRAFSQQASRRFSVVQAQKSRQWDNLG